jgi:hypothetical protein
MFEVTDNSTFNYSDFYNSPFTGLGQGYIPQQMPLPSNPYEYRNHTDEICNIQQLVSYIKKEFERLDARLDKIENEQKIDAENIKAEIKRAEAELNHRIKMI